MALQIGELFWIYDCVGNHYYIGMIKFVPNVSLSAEANISKELTVFKNPHFNCDCNYCVLVTLVCLLLIHLWSQ